MRYCSIICSLIILLVLASACFADTGKPPKSVKPAVTFIELGSVGCVPCKMMKPVMQAIEEEYAGKVKVVFYDVKVKKDMVDKYKVRVIPTQVFLNSKGIEFFRHEGFYPKDEIVKLIDKQLNIKRKPRE